MRRSSLTRAFVKIIFFICLTGCTKSGIGPPVSDRPQLPIMPQQVIEQFYAFPKNDTLDPKGFFENKFEFSYYESDLTPFRWGTYRNSYQYSEKLRALAKSAYKQIVTKDVSVTVNILEEYYFIFEVHSVSGLNPSFISPEFRMSDLKD